jgi:hypothetical protein
MKYDYANTTGNGAMLRGLLDGYDSSGDFWKLEQNKDGGMVLVDDGKKNQMTIEYYENGELLGSTTNILSDVVENGGRAAGLAKMLGLDIVGQMIGQDVSGMSFNDAGESLLAQNGFIWDDVKGTWGEGTLGFGNCTINGNLYTTINDSGTFNWNSVTEEIIRDPLSYAIMNSGEKNKDFAGRDSINVTMWDLNGNAVQSFSSSGWTTVQTQIPNAEEGNITGYGYNNFVKVPISVVHGYIGTDKVGPETIAPGEVSYRLMERQYANSTLQLGKGDPYFQAVSGNIMSGSAINSYGQTALSSAALLQHATANFTNTGCFVTGNMAGTTGIANWNSYMNTIITETKMPTGYVMRANVSHKANGLIVGTQGR